MSNNIDGPADAIFQTFKDCKTTIDDTNDDPELSETSGDIKSSTFCILSTPDDFGNCQRRKPSLVLSYAKIHLQMTLPLIIGPRRLRHGIMIGFNE